jgi:phage repressor protein C with HTH and peptisase S24 domain
MSRTTAIRPTVAAQLLREGGAVAMPLGGSSMRPLFTPGDTLRIDPATAVTVAPGDIVVLDLDGQLLVHRLVYKTAWSVVTRGDDSPACDPPQPHAAVIGRVDVAPSSSALYATLRALLRR